jgi:DNA polymerase III subunit delta
MIVKHYELAKKLNDDINFYLLYGSNIGLIEETINNTLKPLFSKNIYYYDEVEILNNVDDFKESVLNKSFFENDKLIIINRTSEKILNLIEEIADKNIEDLKFIFKSNNLEKKSKLRNYFEKNLKTVIVPYYEDNHQALSLLTQNFFRNKKIKISSQNINLIVERSKGNRIHLKNELEKVANYNKNKTSIELDEIIKLTNLAENYNVSELADQCLSKNKKKTLNILNENNPSSEDNILILKTFLYKLKRLKKLKKELEITKNSEAVISAYRPPIFWKEKDIIKQQLQIWSLNQIKTLIKKINELELLIKKNSQISNQIVNNFILEKLNLSNN